MKKLFLSLAMIFIFCVSQAQRIEDTKMAKKENYPPYKADQVQKVRYQASDTFTNSPKQAKKRGYLEEIFTESDSYKAELVNMRDIKAIGVAKYLKDTI